MEFSVSDYLIHRLDRLKECIERLEASLSADEDRYKQTIKLLEDKDGWSEKDQIKADFFYDDISLYDEARQFYRQSSFLMLYAFLEDSMQKICELITARFKYDVLLDDIEGRGISKAEKWLKKVAHVNISDILWAKLHEYRSIRNQLAHEFGEIDKEKRKNIHKVVEKNDLLETDDWGFTEFIRMKDGFINEFIVVMKEFFKEIDQETSQKLKIKVVKS